MATSAESLIPPSLLPNSGRRHPAFLTGILLLLPAVLAGQDPRIEISRTDQPVRAARAKVLITPPVIDGRLDDAAWAEAPALTEFLQREPDLGAHATERTEIRFLVDGDALYVGAWLFDRDRGGIIPGERIRDGLLTTATTSASSSTPTTTGRTGSCSRPRRPASSTTPRS